MYELIRVLSDWFKTCKHNNFVHLFAEFVISSFRLQIVHLVFLLYRYT